MQCLVRPAAVSELPTAFALLPHLLNQAVPSESVLVAEQSGVSGILGAAAFSIMPTDTKRPGVRGDLFVLPSVRRQGIGTALLGGLRTAVKQWGVEYLHTWDSSEIGKETGFLEKSGFSPMLKVFQFEAETPKADEICTGLVERLKAAGRIPQGAVLVPLHSAERGEASRLYAHYFQVLEPNAAQSLNQSLLDETARNLSLALLLDGEMIGFILWKMEPDGVPKVDLWISVPRLRHGWPAILMLQGSISRLSRLGYARGRFECNEQTKATLNIAQSIGARMLRITTRHVIHV